MPHAQSQAPTPPPIPQTPSQVGGRTAAPAPEGSRVSPPTQGGDAPVTGADVAGQDALRNAEIALQNAIEAQINAGRAVTTGTGVPRQEQIPPEVIPIVGIVFGSLTVMLLGYPIIRFITRVIEKRLDRSALPASEVNAQLRTLQNSLDTMAIEIERISEAQRFQAKLMAERERVALPESRGGA